MVNKKIIRIAILGLMVLAGVSTSVLLSQRPERLPDIQGVIIPEGKSLSQFRLLDHNNSFYTNAELLGQWTLVSYGYTDCPDVCPMMLSKLAKLERQLMDDGRYSDLSIVFYSIDPLRDNTEKLNEYVGFFSDTFTGLTIAPEQATLHVPFETSLGISARLTPLEGEEKNQDYKGYEVAHGVMLYLINPQGQLQAIFKPETNKHGIQTFSLNTLIEDYRSLRDYFG